jgi:hypothetical protein
MDTMGVCVQALDTGWTLWPDAHNVGRRENWPEQARAEALPAPVPGLIQEVFPDYRGIAWYWCRFRLPRPTLPHERCLLRFGAVDYQAEVWLNGRPAGRHEGREAPFALDVTGLLGGSGDQFLAVRVHGLTENSIEGLRLEGSPRGCNPFLTGGIHRAVEVALVPCVRITEVFARPAWVDGRIRLDVVVTNDTASVVTGALRSRVLALGPGEVVTDTAASAPFPPGASTHRLHLHVPDRRAWSLEDPYLYMVATELDASGPGLPRLQHTATVRIGFRDFRVEGGYFRLNGRRVFLRCMHTAPFFPVGGAVPRGDLARRDLILAKAAGFNMVRFIVSTALPEQLDCADEIGLMVYEESPASWLMEDSPRMEEHFDRSVRAAIERDRNHPCITIWGLLNETIDRRRFYHAVNSLPMVRALDDSRLVLLQSGRHDGTTGIGSLCNPDHDQWECQWGAETPGAAEVVKDAVGQGLLGYYPGMGDFHVYPPAPQNSATNRFLRTVGQDTRPVFLSEYGIGSQLDVIASLRLYEQAGAPSGLPDVARYRSLAERFEADWRDYGMDGVYTFAQDMLLATQRLHRRQRLLGFDLIRANPRICGFSLTSMIDGTSGEGVWDFFRRPKPGVLDALADGWSPLRWCLFVDPAHSYGGRPARIEAVLANEDVLAPGQYPVRLRIRGPEGVVWERRSQVIIPGPGTSDEPPLAVVAVDDEVVIDGPSGEYELAAALERGGYPEGGRLSFHVTAPADLGSVPGAAAAWGLTPDQQQWLRSRGLSLEPWPGTDRRGLILVGAPGDGTPERWAALWAAAQAGATVVCLCPEAWARGDTPMAYWPEEPRGERCEPYDSLYHKSCVAARHPVFAGLPAPGVLDWEYYGGVIPRYHLRGQRRPDEVIAVCFTTCYPGENGYDSGLLAGSYTMGPGSFVFSTFRLLEHLGQHPAADRLLLNLIRHAQKAAG